MEQELSGNSALTAVQINEAQWDELIDGITEHDALVDVTGTDAREFIQYLQDSHSSYRAPTYDELIEMAGEIGIEIM